MKLKLVLSVLGFGFICSISNVFAATLPTGITVSPAIQQVKLSQGQNQATFNTNVTNNTLSTITIKISALDFTSLNQTGAVSFINSSSLSNNPHGLTNFIDIPTPQITLLSRQSQTVPVDIINATKLQVGGHYTAIVFKQVGQIGKGTNSVSISQGVTSLVFLSTNGEGTQTTKLLSVAINKSFLSFPSSTQIVLQNQGNTQTTPRGIVQITNSKHEVISATQINTTSNLILPGSSRLFNFSLPKPQGHIWPGFYTLSFYYRHDGQPNYNLYQKKFLYLGWPFIFIILIVIVLIYVLYNLFIFLRRKLVKNHT